MSPQMETAVDRVNLGKGEKYHVRLQFEMVTKQELCSPFITTRSHNSLYSRPTCGGDASQRVPNNCVVDRNHRHQILRVRGQIGELQRGDCSI